MTGLDALYAELYATEMGECDTTANGLAEDDGAEYSEREYVPTPEDWEDYNAYLATLPESFDIYAELEEEGRQEQEFCEETMPF